MLKPALGLALLVCTAGCNRDAAPPPPGPGSGSAPGAVPASVRCTGAVWHSMSVEQIALKREMPGLTDEMVGKLITVAVERCTTDGWSPVAINCYTDGKTIAALDPCEALLTADQKAKLDKATNATLATFRVAADHGCGAALANSMPLELAELKQRSPNLSAPVLAKIKDLTLSHCRKDWWSPVVVSCLATVVTAADIAKCPELSVEQAATLQQEIRWVVEAATPR